MSSILDEWKKEIVEETRKENERAMREAEQEAVEKNSREISLQDDSERRQKRRRNCGRCRSATGGGEKTFSADDGVKSRGAATVSGLVVVWLIE